MVDFNSRITNQPRQIQKPMCRQAFRPGQWDTMKIGARSNTYIQNNFYGAQTSYRGWGDAWASYDYGQPSQNSSKPGVLGWIGLGLGALGGILGGILGNKKSTEEPEQGALESKTEPKVQPEKVQPKKVEQEKVEPEEVEPEDDKKDPTVDNYDWNTNFSTYAMDEEDANGKSPTEDISGSIKVTEKGEDGKAPQKFTLSDSRGGNTYTFEKIKTADGSVKYKCTGATGNKNTTYTKGNVYDCELKNGKPVLIQKQGTEGWGMGLDRANRLK